MTGSQNVPCGLWGIVPEAYSSEFENEAELDTGCKQRVWVFRERSEYLEVLLNILQDTLGNGKCHTLLPLGAPQKRRVLRSSHKPRF